MRRFRKRLSSHQTQPTTRIGRKTAMSPRNTNLVASFALSFLLLGAPAQAYEVETGPVLICDAQEQVERFVQAFDGNQDLAINTVNVEEHDPNACAVVNSMYVLG